MLGVMGSALCRSPENEVLRSIASLLLTEQAAAVLEESADCHKKERQKKSNRCRPPKRSVITAIRKERAIRGGEMNSVRIVAALLLVASMPAFAENYLTDWPAGKDPVEIGTRVAERLLPIAHQEMPYLGEANRKSLHYAEVVTWYGALTFAELAKQESLTTKLITRFEPFFTTQADRVPPINHVDASVFGAVPLELYRQTARYPYRLMGLAFADGQWDRPQPDGLTNQTRYWIDDMYMITLLQVQAYRATSDMKYLDRAAVEMVAYLKRLQQPNGLFFHAPQSPFFWGRGNGWMAAGMTELLSALPENHPHRAAVLDGYHRMMASLLKYQAKQGMWRQLVDRAESWPETSATGMFTFAFVTGVKKGWLDERTYGPAARKAWIALVGYVNADADVSDVCVGTGAGDSVPYYLDRPRATGDLHGQAPILWSASALLR
jgi:unsaturated rhamnogalacturonyl hydrolase